MGKRVLIISTSLRKDGNSETLAEQFAKGAQEAGHSVERISLRGKTIGFCTGCIACQTQKRCVLRDDADAIAQKMLDAQVIAFATPIYFYELSGQMKTLLDRTNPLHVCDYAFRELYLLATAAMEEKTAIDGAVKGLISWTACFKKAALKGVVGSLGVADVGDIVGKPALREAYELGKTL